MKTLYTEATALTKYLNKEEEIEEGNLSVEKMKFQIEGSTIIHLFALNGEALNIILEFLEENRKEYLGSILMKNDEGDTPIDITIKYHSPRNTDLLLKYLSHLKGQSLSSQIYQKFPELLKMKLTSFHQYLDSCLFQTVQMRNAKYLSLKDDSEVVMVAHSSSILDKKFIENHTKQGIAEKKLREKQIEINARAKKAEEDRKEELKR